ncbi:peptidylprolyl isomerase [Luteolibacter arcticus]|uniref:peptidylprolyl isomerase n=1 Tax=Luteolibacter arcticus TaxID=1581411 RepID=A0ABT3GMZ2_9BACT|nr:peptidylprolyl isomerase [Luteolibacter arcticus]MCW1924864.1 peptidylprolyl isomerase [Luteolibacter arcticus]
MGKCSSLLGFAGLLFLLSARAEESLPDGLYAEVTTPRGVVVAELHFKEAPMTVANYVGLAEGTLGPKKGTPFFDGLTFHRVVADFVVQGGDPTATGDGDAGYLFPDEITPALSHDRAGVVQMANDGPDTNGSQWCFMLREVHRLDYLHSVFGHVVRGLEVLPKIEQGDRMKVKILRVGAEAGAFVVSEKSFAGMTGAAKAYGGPREPGPDAPFDDPDKILPTDWDRAKAFNFKLANFERFTGRRLRARVLEKTPAGGIDAYLKETAARVGVEKDGVLAVYCKDLDRWHLKVGEQCRTLLANDAAEVALLAEAGKRTEAAVDYATRHLPEGQQALAANQKIKLSVDSVIDGLITKLEAPAR